MELMVRTGRHQVRASHATSFGRHSWRIREWISAGKRRNAVNMLQVRLSIEGLVADRFEGLRARNRAEKIDDLFEKRDGGGSLRVAIDREGIAGYICKVWRGLRS